MGELDELGSRSSDCLLGDFSATFLPLSLIFQNERISEGTGQKHCVSLSSHVATMPLVFESRGGDG